MESTINALKDTPVPTILVWAGLFFILIAFVSKIGGMIEVPPGQKRGAIFIGLLLLTTGVVLSLAPTPPIAQKPTIPKPSQPSGSKDIPTVTAQTLPPAPSQPSPEKPIISSPSEGSQALTQKDIEPIFDGFVGAWNSGQYKRQLSFVSQDFISVTCHGDVSRSCKEDNFNEYESMKKETSKIYQWIRVNTSNVDYVPNQDGTLVVKYIQHYDSPKYESWGTNELYFRRKGGEVKIFKEVFYRDRFRNK